MPAILIIDRPDAHPGTTLGEALGPVHERWLAEVHAAIAPALLGPATIWDRWSAARYLGDQFTTRLEQERELVRRMPGVDRVAQERIQAGYQTLERVRAQIDAAGRRRHTGGLVMLLLANLLELLANWCAAIEHAAARIPLTALPADAAGLLAELEAEASHTGV